ncbi:COG4315 family predicted lipoprotein [Amycolatopsis taiwanensis]|uniref:Lipoprotein n=1 Tax=Amycolatopsis taiwanensis TaxID=342230 RepID=A0A9W6R330_9PSEU|nr:hypothetical protein [Amycolatopsis taiwanensis]GLY66752.1 hypothetical protein Atai01_33710 [Amycolatopsis taiwanensis]
MGNPLQVQPGQPRRRLLRAPVAMAALALPVAAAVLAACSGSGGSGGYGSPAQPQSGGGASSGAVTVHDVSGLGQTLVDGSGKTLYYADLEETGTLHCTGDCLGFWFPVTTQDASALSGTPGLATMQRSDNGQQQVTYQGKPLYTFRLDKGPGDAMGNNFGDDFSGQHFTWHAATVGAAAQQPAPTSQSSSGGGDGGYGY